MLQAFIIAIENFIYPEVAEVATGDVLYKKGVLKNFAQGLQFYWKRDSDTGVFLQILSNF